jgi:hypothetical protein
MKLRSLLPLLPVLLTADAHARTRGVSGRSARARGVASLLPSARAAGPVFAVVIGVNRPIGGGTQRLLHADDDAILFHRLLGTAGYSQLLVEPDNESILAHGSLPEARLPTRANLERALATQFAAMRLARRRGLRPSFFFVYSGHGDVKHRRKRRRGFLALSDGRLYARDLARLVLARSPASTNHVIIDACRSHFLVHGVPAGRHGRDKPRRHAPRRPYSLARRFPAVGFVLSTSSAHSSHEWTELGAGVFSHEVRSGMMGAADVNSDGRVSYDELWAFIQAANARVPGRRFRPRIHMRPPRATASSVLLDLRGFPGASVAVPGGGRFVLEDGRGVRLADFHAAPTLAVTLRLPQDSRADAHLYLHDLRRLVEYPIPAGIALAGPGRAAARAPFTLESLPGRPSQYRVKGEAHAAYSHLFEVPFGLESHRELLTCRPGGGFPCRYSRPVGPTPSPAPVTERGDPGRSAPARGVASLLPSARVGEAASAPRPPALAVALDLRAMTQRLDVDQPISPTDREGHAFTRSDWFAALGLGVRFYPLSGKISHLGLAGHYYRSIGLVTHPSDGHRASASLQELCLGPRYRWNILRRPESPVLTAGIDGGFHHFELDGGSDSVPDLHYLFVRLALVELEVPLLARGPLGLELDLGFHYRLVLSSGEIEDADPRGYGPASSTGGVEVSGGLRATLNRTFLRLTGFLERYAFEFDPAPCELGPCHRLAAGAVDLYYGLDVSVGYRY